MAKDYSRKLEVDCDRCGTFRISDQALDALPPGEKHLLSYVCRTWSSDRVPDILTTNMQALIRHAPVRGVAEKMDWLLEMYAKRTSEVGQPSEFQLDKDYPRITARSVNEAGWLRKELCRRGFLDNDGPGASMTVKGWERFDQLRQSGPNSAFVFVAMSFRAALAELFDKAIAPAVRQAGYEPIRVDRKEHANSIDDEILGTFASHGSWSRTSPARERACTSRRA